MNKSKFFFYFRIKLALRSVKDERKLLKFNRAEMMMQIAFGNDDNLLLILSKGSYFSLVICVSEKKWDRIL